MLTVVVAVLIGWLIASVVLALAFGRAVRLADARTSMKPAPVRNEHAPVRLSAAPRLSPVVLRR